MSPIPGSLRSRVQTFVHPALSMGCCHMVLYFLTQETALVTHFTPCFITLLLAILPHIVLAVGGHHIDKPQTPNTKPPNPQKWPPKMTPKNDPQIWPKKLPSKVTPQKDPPCTQSSRPCCNQNHQIYEAIKNWIFVFKIGAILQINFKCEYLSS